MTSTRKNQLKLFRNGDKQVMRQVYIEHKTAFLGYFNSQTSAVSVTAEDLYQDSFCVLHKNILSGKLTHITASWSTILIGIGKNLLRNKMRKKSELLGKDIPEKTAQDNPYSRLIEKEKIKQTKSILGLVGETCREVLVAFYYNRKSMVEIAQQMNYASANVAKKKKSQCLKKLRDEIKKYRLMRHEL